MTKEKKQPQIIAEPLPLASTEELQKCNDEELSCQLRLFAVEQIRLIRAGKLKPTDGIVKNLKDLNASLRDYGKPELPLDFLN
jgi:hypothetical protein